MQVDERYLSGEDDKALGWNECKEKIMVIGMYKIGNGVSMWFGMAVEVASKVNLLVFILVHVRKDTIVKTDFSSGYNFIESHFPNLTKDKSCKKGGNFKQMFMVIMTFKAWLRRTHYCFRYLLPYINEYTCRYIRHKMKEGIVENLIRRMVEKHPFLYKIFTV